MIGPYTLESDGLNPNSRADSLLLEFGVVHVTPLHLHVARALAADPVLLRRLQGARLDEFLLDLLGFEHVRACLTRRFFTTYHARSEEQEPIWWAAAWLDWTLRTGLMSISHIGSVEKLIILGQEAKSHRGSSHEKFPPGPP